MADRLPKTQREQINVIRRQLRAIDRLANEMMERGHEIHRRLLEMERGPMRRGPKDAGMIGALMDELDHGSA